MENPPDTCPSTGTLIDDSAIDGPYTTVPRSSKRTARPVVEELVNAPPMKGPERIIPIREPGPSVPPEGPEFNYPPAPGKWNYETPNDTLKSLQARPIVGYTAPKSVTPGNNRGGIYSKYNDRPGDSGTSAYQTTGKHPTLNYGFNKAYAVKPCVMCEQPLDQCACAVKSSRPNTGR